jgi:uncharacterized protein YndB with AHSA1/START domain
MSHAVVLSTVLVLAAAAAAAEEPRAVHVAEVDAGLTEVWAAFTTDEGLRTWMAPLAEIELAVGGTIRTSFDPGGSLEGDGAIVNTILAYDPQRMLALAPTGYPDAFPFAAAMRATWSVYYFDEVSPSRTRITVVGLGYTDGEDSQKLRAFFEPANAELMRRLRVAVQQRREGLAAAEAAAAGGGP